MKLKYEMEVLEIDGSPIAVPIDSGDEFRGVLYMNETTQDILNILKNNVTINQLISELKNIYDSSDEEICTNVDKVLGILREYKLLDE